MSMYQHPDESKEIYRSPEKERLFQTGIEGMSNNELLQKVGDHPEVNI